MTQPAFNRVAGLLFLLIAVLHALRLLFDWEILIAGWNSVWSVPQGLSWIALALSGFLAAAAFRIKR